MGLDILATPATQPVSDNHCLDACFLGPYGENDSMLEKLVVEFLRDHVYWRRNFHPEDPPAIPTRAAQHPDYLAFEARLRRELHQLSAALKKSVPFHSIRLTRIPAPSNVARKSTPPARRYSVA